MSPGASWHGMAVSPGPPAACEWERGVLKRFVVGVWAGPVTWGAACSALPREIAQAGCWSGVGWGGGGRVVFWKLLLSLLPYGSYKPRPLHSGPASCHPYQESPGSPVPESS